MILAACFISSAQRIVVADLDFNILRILILFGWTRLFLRNEINNFRWKTIDKVVIVWAVCGIVVCTLLLGTFASFVFKLGTIFDMLGMYFLFRMLIRNWSDIDVVVFILLVVSIPVMLAFLIESTTGRNVFSIFGGVPAITDLRDGKLRCQGAFSHPIMAGCFWSSLMPLFTALWWAKPKGRLEAVVGLATTGFLVLMCSSSTPMVSVAFGILGGLMFPFRYYMKIIRWGVFIFLIGLHIIMNAPVWHLISRVNIFASSTGWYRFHLIDQAIRHLDEWWLMGVSSTSHWDQYGRLTDITNQYVLEGVRGGLLTLLLFIITISLAFQGVGKLWRVVEDDKLKSAMAWALGVSLFMHCMNFIAVSYFGQINMLFYLLLAIIATLTPSKVPVSVIHHRGTLVRRRKKKISVIS
jgi:hypothetical protein